MPDPLLEARQHRLLVAGVDVDDAVRVKTDLGQSRREKVLPGDAPQNLALGARRDAGGKQGSHSAIDGGVATSCHFVQRPERQAPAGEPAIDGFDTKGEHRPGTLLHALKALNLLAKPPDGGWPD